jgi:hypothetical protein
MQDGEQGPQRLAPARIGNRRRRQVTHREH